MHIGTVTLVGAGPSGRDLLTLKGAQAIAGADAVVFDRLVSEDILDLIPRTAARINVGKQNNNHPVPQDEINEILVQLAREGKNTVRLKGGDCFLFGRGGEECEYLLQNSVPFEVVPGVTSALAAPAYAGIPVTHRDYCSSVHIITAHARAGAALEIDFESLAKLRGTLVFLMGLGALEQVMEGLLAAGIAPDMPAAVVENGTRGNQRKVVADVRTLPAQVRQAGLGSPALIVVGRVCALSESLDWFTAQPLHGKTIVVTRPYARAGTLSDALRRQGAHVIECPCIDTEELADVSMLTQALYKTWHWVALTSPAGVDAMVHALRMAGKDMRSLWGCKFAVVGAGTARQLKKYGIEADLTPKTYDGAHLGEALVQALDQNERVLILRAEQGTSDLTEKLRAAEIAFADIPTYRTVYRSDKAEMLRELVNSGGVHTVAFTSASTVEGFVQAVPDVDFTAFTALCIGTQTATAAEKYSMRTLTAKQATIDSMVAVLLEELSNDS